jgi:hypothetical protein
MDVDNISAPHADATSYRAARYSIRLVLSTRGLHPAVLEERIRKARFDPGKQEIDSDSFGPRRRKNAHLTSIAGSWHAIQPKASKLVLAGHLQIQRLTIVGLRQAAPGRLVAASLVLLGKEGSVPSETTTKPWESLALS